MIFCLYLFITFSSAIDFESVALKTYNTSKLIQKVLLESDISLFSTKTFTSRNLDQTKCVELPQDDSSCKPPKRKPSTYTHLRPDEVSDSHFPVSRIAFTSCILPNDKEVQFKFWKHMRKKFRPDLFIWLGDNMYSDGEDMNAKRMAYNDVRENKAYRTYGPIAEPKIPVTGVWDDHDYGANNDGESYDCRVMTQREFCIHFNIPETDVRHPDYQGDKCKQRGIYKSYFFPPPRNITNKALLGLQLINLDTRFDKSRTQDRCSTEFSTMRMLSAEQWDWLSIQLFDVKADVKIISTPVQALTPTSFDEGGLDNYCAYRDDPVDFIQSISDLNEGEETGMVGGKKCLWSEMPSERLKLLRWAQKSINIEMAKKVIFISGGMHYGDMLAKKMPQSDSWGRSQTLYEVVASSVGKETREYRPNSNRVRLRTCDDRGNSNFVKECKFPFIYNGVKHRDCITDEDNKIPFCYFDKLEDGKIVTEKSKWGYCLPEVDELVPKKHQYVTKNHCGDYHQACNKYVYGGIDIDWENTTMTFMIYTPTHEDALASSMELSFR